MAKKKSKPSKKATAKRDFVRARAAGITAANEVVARREKRLAAGPKLAAPSPGILVAEGDSWFDFPFSDILEELEDEHRWQVTSVAHKGDRVEDMAYDEGQLSKLERELRKLMNENRTPRAFLLSGGGNDIAGEELAVLLNHRKSGLPEINEQVAAGIFEERIATAVATVAFAVTRLSEQFFGTKLPILMHGYDRPVPDGRGFLGGFWVLPGPWLEPSFRRKGYADLVETTRLMGALIDLFNDQIQRVAGSVGLEHMHYVNLRGTLSSDLAKKAYKKSWTDELHPTRDGFKRVATQLHAALLAKS